MKGRAAVAIVALLPLFACSGHAGGGSVLPTASQSSVNAQEGAMALPGGEQSACTGSLELGNVQCPVILNTLLGIVSNTLILLLGESAIPGYHPSDIRSAYDLPSTGGSGATVAVVDEGDDPNAASDLAVYRKEFGLPACTTANGCFRKASENGETDGSGLPAPSQEWSMEIAVDLDMVSAVCPQCHILLVEANSSDITDFGTAVDTAVNLGATEISNSYYTDEYAGVIGADQYYDHPGIPITAAAGDGGYGVVFPASSQYVTAVGATTLTKGGGSRGWTESAWSYTGSGCSAYIAKPSWQTDTGCAMRTVTDVAVDGDPKTGVAAYNTYASAGEQGWGVYGGTSIGAPIVAAIYALAGNGASVNGASYAYAHRADFYAITSGSNGSCSPSYLCTAGAGYNGPTGLGTPNGIGAF